MDPRASKDGIFSDFLSMAAQIGDDEGFWEEEDHETTFVGGAWWSCATPLRCLLMGMVRVLFFFVFYTLFPFNPSRGQDFSKVGATVRFLGLGLGFQSERE